MKLVLKGIDKVEDPVLAREQGVDGIVVSNHCGRAADTGRGSIDILPEVIDAVGSRINVPLASGVDDAAYSRIHPLVGSEARAACEHLVRLRMTMAVDLIACDCPQRRCAGARSRLFPRSQCDSDCRHRLPRSGSPRQTSQIPTLRQVHIRP